MSDQPPAMSVAVLRQDARIEGAVLDGLRNDDVAVHRFDTVDALLAADPAVLATVRVLLAPGHAPVTGAVLDRLPALSGLLSTYMGIEGFDRAAATARGVLIGNGQLAESVESMAEGTILMLLAAAYRLPEAIAAMANGGWPTPVARGRLVRAMTVGVVGFGQIAQAVVHRLLPFGCRVVVHAPRLRAPLPPGVEAVTFDALLATSDAVVLLASLGADSRHMLDATAIARLMPGTIIVNTARGGLIDEPALLAAAGRLGPIALDVFEQEPLPADGPIRNLPDAILTPHSIGHTGDTLAALPRHALDGIRRLLRGEPPPALVNPEALSAWKTRASGSGTSPLS